MDNLYIFELLSSHELLEISHGLFCRNDWDAGDNCSHYGGARGGFGDLEHHESREAWIE